MKIRVFTGALLLATVAGAAQAQTFAFTVEQVNQGLSNHLGEPVRPSRSNPLMALGAPGTGEEGSFFSLGFGGSLTLGFGGEFGEFVTVWETTYGNIAEYPERVQILVGSGVDAQSASYFLAGEVLNLNDGLPVSLASANLLSGRSTYNFVRLIDISDPNAVPIGGDGFDVDAVAVGPVPAPGSLALLAAAGLVGARRRRNRV